MTVLNFSLSFQEIKSTGDLSSDVRGCFFLRTANLEQLIRKADLYG